MKGDKIDIDKSILTGKLKSRTWLIEPVLDCIFYSALIFSFPLSSGLLLFAQINREGNLFYATILLIATIFLSGFLLYSVLNHNKLRRIQGISKEQNIEFTAELVRQLGWKITTHDQQILIANPTGRWFSSNWHRQVVIIYDKHDFWINCTYYGLHDFKSPFHWFGNRKLERQLIEGFEEKIKTTNR
jgi:hypothetical protein